MVCSAEERTAEARSFLPFTGASDGTPELRSAVGPGSARPDLPCDAGDPPELTPDYVRERRCHAGHLRDAAGRFAVPASGRLVPENLWGNDLLRNGLPARTCDCRSSRPLQLHHDGGAHLVLA